MEGALTVNTTLLLATLLTVTTTLLLPAANPLGTAAVMLVALQALTVAAIPPKVTLLDPCVEPKLVPVTVTEAPIGPEVGDKLVIVGEDCAWPMQQKIKLNRKKPTTALFINFICIAVMQSPRWLRCISWPSLPASLPYL